jgi:aspartyl-tRNA(Asn)/glutamyl-tRNA(Gln) amidotransferase subunit B
MIITSQNGKKYKIVIGLEVHAQIKTNAKLFSKAKNNWNSKPNHNVAIFDIAMPGSLPVLNMGAVKQAVKTGLAINATINKVSRFDRKNYFYPDLPSGYQITQAYNPIVENGYLDIISDNGKEKRIRIERIHIEQDAGKSIHDRYPDKTALDFNRSGVGLMEIVSKPDINTPLEACEYIKGLRSILKTIDTSDADMEKGSMRCDVNISVCDVNSDIFGTRCEIKNVNSLRSVVRAIEYEANRQVDIIESGNSVDQETRLFDENTGETRRMRSKEDAVDYRYFPEPNIMPIRLSDEFINEIKEKMPELPSQKIARYTEKLGLNKEDALLIGNDISYSSYFDKLSQKFEPKMCITWMKVELFGRLNKMGLSLDECNVSVDKMSELLDLISSGKINGKIAKDVLDKMLETGKTASSIVADEGLEQVDNTTELEKIADEVIANNPQQYQDYKAGKDKLFAFFVGQVMKETKGKANPASINEILKKKLS